MLFIFYFKEKYIGTPICSFIFFFFFDAFDSVTHTNTHARRYILYVDTHQSRESFDFCFRSRYVYIYTYVFYVSKKPSDKVIYYSSGGVGLERGPAAARVITRASGARHRRSDRICPSIVYI